MSAFRHGDVVEVPGRGFGIVEKCNRARVELYTESGEVVARPPEGLRRRGRIVVGKTYTAPGGNRWAMCVYLYALRSEYPFDVLVREGRGGIEETRKAEIRRMAFRYLLERREAKAHV